MRLHAARVCGRSPIDLYDLGEPPGLHEVCTRSAREVRISDLGIDLGPISALGIEAQASELLSVLAMRARMSWEVR